MGLHDDTIAIAHERGYLTFPEVDLVRNRAPAWIFRLACPDGVAEYQARSGVTLPRALVDFYAATDLVCFLVASGQGSGIFDAQTYGTDCNVRPPVEVLFGRKYVIVDEHWHSASRGCLPLDAGDDPPVYGSIADDPLFEIAPSFTKYVHDPIERYDRFLREWKEKYAARPDNPGYAWVPKLPGFDRLTT
jgi:hypothetical protein